MFAVQLAANNVDKGLRDAALPLSCLFHGHIQASQLSCVLSHLGPAQEVGRFGGEGGRWGGVFL